MASFLDLFYLSCTKKLIEFWNKEAIISEIDCGDIFIASGNANWALGNTVLDLAILLRALYLDCLFYGMKKDILLLEMEQFVDEHYSFILGLYYLLRRGLQ
jgi:hypothetical protein